MADKLGWRGGRNVGARQTTAGSSSPSWVAPHAWTMCGNSQTVRFVKVFVAAVIAGGASAKVSAYVRVGGWAIVCQR